MHGALDEHMNKMRGVGQPFRVFAYFVSSNHHALFRCINWHHLGVRSYLFVAQQAGMAECNGICPICREPLHTTKHVELGCAHKLHDHCCAQIMHNSGWGMQSVACPLWTSSNNIAKTFAIIACFLLMILIIKSWSPTLMQLGFEPTTFNHYFDSLPLNHSVYWILECKPLR